MEQRKYQVSHDHPLFFTLFATLFMIAFSFTNPYMASPYIVGDLGGSNSISIYAVAFFGVGSALSIPLGKPMLAHLHVRKTLVYCVLAMALFTFLCGVAPNYPIFLIFRFLLGFAAGPLYSALNYSISNLVSPEKKAAALSIFVTIMTVVPVLSACWGGFIAYEFIWRWIYYINVPFFLLLVLMLSVTLEKIDLRLPKSPFDLVGYFFFFVSILTLSFCAITAQELDWQRSPLLVCLTLIGLPCFIFYVLWSWYHPYPVLNLRMLKNWTFSFALFNLTFLFSAYFGMITLLSLWLKLYVNYTPYWIGAVVGGMAFAGLLPRFLIEGRLSKIDPRIPLGLAILFLAISCFYTTAFDAEINFNRVAFSRIIAGFGLALFLPPIFQMSFQSFPSNKSVDVIELFQFVRNLAAGIGASSYNILWQRREAFFHERLGEKLNVFSQPTLQFFSKVKQLKVAGDPNAQLDYLLERQATSLALDDTFWLMAWLMVGLFIFLILTLRWTKLVQIK